MKEYKTLKDFSYDEIIINKSKFIGYAKNCESEEKAREFISEINKKHYDATHNCYAYIIGDNKNIMKCSDDGEPSGTAGVPILETLKKEDLTNTCIVVTRYFGGVKLGAGGLIRAYTQGAVIAINSNIIVEKLIYSHIKFTVDYTFIGSIQNYLDTNNILFAPPTYLENVTFDIYIPSKKEKYYKETFTNLTNGKIKISIMDKVYVDKINNKIYLI